MFVKVTHNSYWVLKVMFLFNVGPKHIPRRVNKYDVAVYKIFKKEAVKTFKIFHTRWESPPPSQIIISASNLPYIARGVSSTFWQ